MQYHPYPITWPQGQGHGHGFSIFMLRDLGLSF